MESWDHEIISTEQATEWFNLENIGRSPARFDLVKLGFLNGHYIKNSNDLRLLGLIEPFIKEKVIL